MRRRLMQGTIFIAVALFAALVGAGGAIAAGQGDPHAGEERGNPHVGDATGDPHLEEAVPVATEASGASAETAAAAPAAVAAPSAAAVTTAARPADGSVGNADDKSPPGQSANDKNRGYECDEDRGVGRGNPAHSGCPAPATPETPTTPTTPSPTDTVLGVQFSRTNAAVAAAGLARTGGEQRSMAEAALLFIVAGMTLVAVARWRRPITS